MYITYLKYFNSFKWDRRYPTWLPKTIKLNRLLIIKFIPLEYKCFLSTHKCPVQSISFIYFQFLNLRIQLFSLSWKYIFLLKYMLCILYIGTLHIRRYLWLLFWRLNERRSLRGRWIPSKIDPMIPGPSWTERGFSVLRTGSPTVTPLVSSYT